MTQYATTANLALLGLPAAALTNVTADTQNAHLLSTGARIDGYLRSHHTLPFSSPYPAELIECNCVMAAYSILTSSRGYNPADVDDQFRMRYDDCLTWLRDIGAGRVALAATADATPTTNEGAPVVVTGGANRAHGTGDTGESRGW